MKVYKPINNNIISAFDDDGAEVILIGRGIGFKAKEGTPVPERSVQKIFRMSSQHETDRLKQMFASIPDAHLEITEDIFSYAKETLKKRLNERAFITLADHISFAVQRFKQGMNFQNLLLPDVRRFYPQEYEIGLYAVGMMEQRLGFRFPDDEAASIAMHIFNAEYDISVSDVFRATKLLDRIVYMIGEKTGCVFDDDDFYCERFLVHLKFLAQRVVKKQPPSRKEDKLEAFISLAADAYPDEAACARDVADYIRREHDYRLSPEETAAMTMHIRRIRN